MSNKRELAKIAREITQIKRTLSAARKGDVFMEFPPAGERKLWKKNITPEAAERLILKADQNGEWGDISAELIFVPYDGGPEMMFTSEWEVI